MTTVVYDMGNDVRFFSCYLAMLGNSVYVYIYIYITCVCVLIERQKRS